MERIPTGIIFWKEGVTLHITETYEHEPILPYQGEDSCPLTGCGRLPTQCVDVAAHTVLTPVAEIGTAVVTCQGTPSVTCVTASSGTSCTVTLTQRVCATIPVRYSVTVTPEDPTIACAAAGTAAGSGCGCAE